MSKVVILGSSPVAVKLIDQLRKKNYAGDISLILFDGFLPYERQFLSHQKNIEQAEWPAIQPAEFFESQKVNVFFDQEISRINTSRKKIFTENKNQLDYDWLIITEMPKNKFPDIKGITKTGLFNARKKKAVATVIEKFSFAENITIVSDDLMGFDLACYFSQKRSDVLLVQSDQGFLNRVFSDEVSDWFFAQLLHQRIKVETANPINEILGDAEIKAVRLDSGKVYATDLVLFDGQPEDLRLFYDSAMEMHDQIIVNEMLQTGEDGVFAVDPVGMIRGHLKFSQNQQAELMTEQIIAKENNSSFEPSELGAEVMLIHDHFDLGELTIDCIGELLTRPQVETKEYFDKDKNEFKKMFILEGIIVGCVLVNLRKEFDKYLNFIGKDVNVTL
ncbi:MAG: NAD(P)/FAD-dependent oxidoreductase [Candidatus Omnitrophica bacterium]|nr:NAD(P)/FAD-dependent oxidoreductase [Candidatus Omnitrophota bacterium]